MSVLQLSWRNALRSFPRRWPLFVLLLLTVALLMVGNSIFDSTSDGMHKTYVQSFTGDWTVSARSKESFTLFGSELPLIGEYFVLPSIPNAQKLLEKIQKTPGVEGAVGQVTAGGQLALDKWSSIVPVFGVQFSEYFALFPKLELLQGTLKFVPGGRLLLSEAQFQNVSNALRRPPRIGEVFTITVFNNNSFTIRQVALQGVYSYPARDEMLDRIVLTDPDTARALNGYVYGNREEGPASNGTSQSQIDDLFTTPEDVTTTGKQSLSQETLEAQLSDTKIRDEQNQTLEGSWNFLLVRGSQSKTVVPDDIQLRDWRASVGGNATIVWLIQLVFNLGLGFVVAGSAFIVINSLALSVAERTKEIGTMRAMGAYRSRVSSIVAIEVLIVVSGSSVFGVLLGAILVELLGLFGIPLANPYLQALFGSSTLHPVLSTYSVLVHFAFSFGLGFFSVLYPVNVALRISPRQAMARGT